MYVSVCVWVCVDGHRNIETCLHFKVMFSWFFCWFYKYSHILLFFYHRVTYYKYIYILHFTYSHNLKHYLFGVLLVFIVEPMQLDICLCLEHLQILAVLELGVLLAQYPSEHLSRLHAGQHYAAALIPMRRRAAIPGTLQSMAFTHFRRVCLYQAQQLTS